MPVFLIAKGVVHVVAGLGVNRIVAEIVRNNTTVVTTADKVLVSAGSIAISSLLVEKSADNINRIGADFAARFKKNEEDTSDEKDDTSLTK